MTSCPRCRSRRIRCCWRLRVRLTQPLHHRLPVQNRHRGCRKQEQGQHADQPAGPAPGDLGCVGLLRGRGRRRSSTTGWLRCNRRRLGRGKQGGIVHWRGRRGGTGRGRQRYRNLLQQGTHRPFPPLDLGLRQHGIGLLRRGRVNFPVQDTPAKRDQQLLFFAPLGQQHHHTDVGAGEVLDEPGQQLYLMVGQGRGVMDDPDFGRRNRHAGLHGLLHRVVAQRGVEARQQGFGAGGEINFDADLGCHRPQALHQDLAVVVQYGLVAAHQRQAHAVLGHGRDHALEPQHVGSPKQQRRLAVKVFGAGGQGRSHAAASGISGLPFVSNSMALGIFGTGRAIGSAPGCTCARLKT